MTTTAALPATLATTDRGATYRTDQVKVDDFIWHKGCYRRVTATDGWTIRMGRHAMKGGTVELFEWWK